MAGLSVYLENNLLSCLRGVAFTVANLYLSLHMGDPGTTGTNEVTGGSPAYARQPITFAAPANGLMASSAGVTFNSPGVTITYLALWDAVSAGNFLGKSLALNPQLVLNTQSTVPFPTGTVSFSLTN